MQVKVRLFSVFCFSKSCSNKAKQFPFRLNKVCSILNPKRCLSLTNDLCAIPSVLFTMFPVPLQTNTLTFLGAQSLKNLSGACMNKF